MNNSEHIEMIIAVTYHGDAYIIAAPVEHMKFVDGSCCEDNNFLYTPEAPGVYRCAVNHRFITHRDDEGTTETDETFIVVSFIPISIPLIGISNSTSSYTRKDDTLMHTPTFPNVEMSPIAGSISYKPWVKMPEEVMEQLPEFLEQAEIVESASDCENKEVLADWRMPRSDWRMVLAEKGYFTTHWSEIICYLNGSDAINDYIPGEYDDNEEEQEQEGYPGIGILFCRKDIDQTNPQDRLITYRVHVPRLDEQKALIEAAQGWLSDRTGKKYEQLNTYLEGVINAPSAWETMDVDTDNT